MASERWHEQLEAYLDGELDDDAADAFAAQVAASPELQAELASRQRFRAVSRRILGSDNVDTPMPAKAPTRRSISRRSRVTAAAALAAAVGLLLLAPALARRRAPAPEIRAGQIVAIRFGEIPGATVTLETGTYDHETNTVH